MSTTENITDPYEYLERQTKWVELPSEIIKRLNLKVSDKTIGNSFLNLIRVYDYQLGEYTFNIAMCDALGSSTENIGLIYIYVRHNNKFVWCVGHIEMLADAEFTKDWFNHLIDKIKRL